MQVLIGVLGFLALVGIWQLIGWIISLFRSGSGTVIQYTQHGSRSRSSRRSWSTWK